MWVGNFNPVEENKRAAADRCLPCNTQTSNVLFVVIIGGGGGGEAARRQLALTTIVMNNNKIMYT